jgi:hypothetical protein
VAVAFVVGKLAATGYTVSVKEPVLGRPVKLAFEHLSGSPLHVAARVWGQAYQKVFVDASYRSVTVRGYHFTEGELTCTRLAGSEDIYVCHGRGYMYVPVGVTEEFLERGMETTYYYSGWVHVVLYGVEQLLFMSLVVASMVTGLASYAAASYGLRSRSLVAYLLLVLASYALGCVYGLASLPPTIAELLADELETLIALTLPAPVGASAVGVVIARRSRSRY